MNMEDHHALTNRWRRAMHSQASGLCGSTAVRTSLRVECTVTMITSMRPPVVKLLFSF